MDKVKLLANLFLLIIIVDGIICDSQCDCTTLADGQELIRAELFQIKRDNFKIKSRLRRLEVSRGTSTRGTSTRPNDGIESKASQQNVDQSVSNDTSINNSKRIDAIESTLTRVMTVLELNEPKTEDTADRAQEVGQENRLDKIESKLESMSNVVLKYDTALKKTIRAEKNNRIKFELRVKQMANEYKPNFIGETKNVIDNFRIEINQKQEQFEEKINGEVININKTVYEHINDIDSSFDNLQDEITETKTKISSIETAKVKDNADFNVAFTAYDLKRNSSSYSTLVFSSTHLNNENSYDTTMGKFTCTISGLYYFSFTLTKEYDIILPFGSAWLSINDNFKLQIWWEFHDIIKHPIEKTPFTNSGVFHLKKNDVVDIVGIPNDFSSGMKSTFTGYLIKAD